MVRIGKLRDRYRAYLIQKVGFEKANKVITKFDKKNYNNPISEILN